MQDTNPLPWGALDRYQAHFIVRRSVGADAGNFVARTVLNTKGHFASKEVGSCIFFLVLKCNEFILYIYNVIFTVEGI